MPKFALPEVLIKINITNLLFIAFLMPKSATDVCNPKEPSNALSMALDCSAKHSTDLTDCQGESSDMAAAADKNSTSSDANPCEKKQVF